MRGLVGRSLVWLLALSFVASGIAARQCDAAHHTTAPITAAPDAQADPSHHAHTPQHAAHAEHDHVTMGHQHASNDIVPMALDDHACKKCCGICTLGAAIAPEVGATVAFTVSAASFPGKSEYCCDTTIPVDPEIPKRIV